MRQFFCNLRKDDRGDQVVGWILLAAIIAIVGGVTWANIADDLDPILGGVENSTQAASDRVTGN